MDHPIVVAIIVFVCIYIAFLIIRLLADMFIVGIALACAVAAYSLEGFDLYPAFRDALMVDIGLLAKLGVNLPEQPDPLAIYTIAAFIIMAGVIACLPFLPFSATYRKMLGVEKLSRKEEDKIKQWVQEELKRDLDDVALDD